MEKLNLEDYRVHGLPKTAYYVPDFISEYEEKYLLDKVYAAPKPKWTNLFNRRLQNWGGLPHPKGMIEEPLPEWLKTYMKKMEALDIFADNKPNHVLINEYIPGQGIMPHEDGPLFHPIITTINLGSHAVLDYYCKRDELHPNQQAENVEREPSQYVGSLLLRRRSLLVVQDDLYTGHLHGIKENTCDTMVSSIANLHQCEVQVDEQLERQTRISMTIRNCPVSTKAKLLFGSLHLR